MSPAPLAAGNPSRQDLDAAEQLEGNEAGRLPLVRARAEKWIGAITAISGILATALIIKGPGDVTQLAIGWRAAAAAAIGGAIALLVHATYHAYQAAYGAP